MLKKDGLPDASKFCLVKSFCPYNIYLNPIHVCVDSNFDLTTMAGLEIQLVNFPVTHTYL